MVDGRGADGEAGGQVHGWLDGEGTGEGVAFGADEGFDEAGGWGGVLAASRVELRDEGGELVEEVVAVGFWDIVDCRDVSGGISIGCGSL